RRARRRTRRVEVLTRSRTQRWRSKLLRELVEKSLAREIRPISRWIEDELVIPDGPYKGQKYRIDRQPFNRLWLAEIDSGRWKKHVALGPSQSGKTLVGFVAPLLWYLFEW